jgi:DNA primase
MLWIGMNGLIPQSFIDELIARTDVIEIIGSRISLKKAGREYKAVCPFHDEKTPSFTVSPHKGFYHCFGCGSHGTAITFLMNYENLGFVDAVEALADIHGLEVPATTQERNSSHATVLYEVLSEADQLYRAALRKHPMATEYLKNRGIDGETAGRFGIGYAPDAWDTILKGLGGNDKRTKDLIESGLVIKNEQGRLYDRFRDRIMFPIRDPRGRIIGFGGRLLNSGEPKYLNSPETPVFHKGQALYGLYEARLIGQKNTPSGTSHTPAPVLVVEGYLDVASLTQHGIGPAVATLGTATTPAHIRQLTRLTGSVIFCFDGDRAGKAAAWKAMETVLPQAGDKVELKFLLLPDGEDPDSLLRSRGTTFFIELMDQAIPLSNFLLDELAKRIDLSSADGKSRLATLTKPLFNRLPTGVYRELLLAQLAERVGLSKERLEALLVEEPRPTSRLDRNSTGQTNHTSPARSDLAQRNPLIRKAIELILHHPKAGLDLKNIPTLIEVNQPGAELLRRLLETVVENRDVTTAGLLERFRNDPEGQHLGRLASAQLLDNGEAVPQVLKDSLERIVQNYRKERLGALLAKNQSLGSQERAELEKLLRKNQKNTGEF